MEEVESVKICEFMLALTSVLMAESHPNWEIMCILDQALNYLEILQLLMDAVLERMR